MDFNAQGVLRRCTDVNLKHSDEQLSKLLVVYCDMWPTHIPHKNQRGPRTCPCLRETCVCMCVCVVGVWVCVCVGVCECARPFQHGL